MNNSKPESILFLNKDGLFRVKAPFKVVSLQNFEELKEGNIYLVRNFHFCMSYKLKYMVNGRYFKHTFFKLSNT